MRILVFLAAAALVLASTPSFAGLSWNFDSGLDGWTIGGNANAKWVDPALEPSGPTLPDGGASGAGGGNLYLPDGGYIRLDLSSQLAGGKTERWYLQADIYVPNLRPLTGFAPWGYPGNEITKAGVFGMSATSLWGIGAEGDYDSGSGDSDFGSAEYINYPADSWQGVPQDGAAPPAWILEGTGADTGWWDDWVTLSIDYSYTTAGVCTVQMTVPWDTPVGVAGTYTIYTGPLMPPNGLGWWMDDDISRIQVGSNPNYASWTQAQFDNVYFDSPDLVPEPGSFIALGVGMVGLLGAVRRRK